MHCVKSLLSGLDGLDECVIIPINSQGRNKSLQTLFYPIQTCSDMCGVILMCIYGCDNV